jgi:hypothetical protein
MPELLEERGTRLPPMPKAKPPRNAFNPNAVKEARALLESALDPAAPAPGQEVNPVYNPDTYGALPLDVPEIYNADTWGQKPVVPQAQQVDRAEMMLADALRAQRERAIGVDRPAEKPRPISEMTERMTPEEYAALTPLQRAGVDFNGMLAGAVRKDRHADYQPTETQQETYNLAVKKMFGEDGGSEQYAPETLALLRQIGYQDENADLDDFLQLKAAVGEKDLERIVARATNEAGETVAGPPVQRHEDGTLLNPVQLDRVALAGRLAQSTQMLQEKLAEGNALLQTMQATAKVTRGQDVAFLGGTYTEPNTMLGYGAAADDIGDLTVDGYFQQAFEALSRKENSRDDILAVMNTKLSPQEIQAFMAYADNRATNALNYGVNLGTEKDVSYRSPEDFRKMLGLDTKGTKDAAP